MPFRLRVCAVRLFRAALIQHFPARKENDMTTAIQTREPNSGTAGADQAPLRPVSGLLDITRRGPAFVRTGGFRAGPDDVSVPASLIQQYGLRPGDHVTGTVRTG